MAVQQTGKEKKKSGSYLDNMGLVVTCFKK